MKLSNWLIFVNRFKMEFQNLSLKPIRNRRFQKNYRSIPRGQAKLSRSATPQSRASNLAPLELVTMLDSVLDVLSIQKYEQINYSQSYTIIVIQVVLKARCTSYIEDQSGSDYILARHMSATLACWASALYTSSACQSEYSTNIRLLLVSISDYNLLHAGQLVYEMSPN